MPIAYYQYAVSPLAPQASGLSHVGDSAAGDAQQTEAVVCLPYLSAR
jgi:hypothetical protein